MRPRVSPRAMYGSTRPPVARNGRLTAATASEPERAARTISAVSIEIRSWASRVWAPEVRRRHDLLVAHQAEVLGRLLGEDVERRAAEVAGLRAPPAAPSSSITPPRPQLTSSAPFFIFARRSRFSRLRVSSVSGVWRVTTSARASRSSSGQQLDLQLAGRRGVEERVVGHDLHLEAAGAVRHPLADAAEADDPQRLALELDAGELAVPLPGLHRGVGLGHPAGEREEEREGVLGGRHQVGRGRVDHQDAELGGGGHVHVVDADAGAPHHLELLAGLAAGRR